MASQHFSRVPVAQRKSPRERKTFAVKLEFDDGSPSIGGMLSDLSATGARASIATPEGLPRRFTLLFPDDARRRCRPIWRSGQSIGIQFMSV